jgi:uncharacterized protein (DUF1499 family)
MKRLNKFQFTQIKISILIGVVIMLWGINGFSVGRPQNIGLKNNLLVACPRSPNCVLSQASDAKHKIKPIYYSTSVEAAKEKLIKVIQSMDATRIITQNKVYWHVKFTTRWLRFIDDVEFYFPESEALIHLRSASRSGYWDLGANRKRVEEIRSRFEELAKEN